MAVIKSSLHTNVFVTTHKLFALLTLSITCFITSQSAIAGANLMITPSRVVFEDRTRTAQVTLLNTGNDSGSFRVSFIRQQMTEAGQFIAVEPNEKGNFSDHMIRYSPRQVTLPPGQSQVVRLMLRKPRDLADGEYRSHMLFQSIPKASKHSLESVMTTNKKGITVEIIPIVGVSIPVIVRQGQLNNEVSISNPRYIAATEANPNARIGIDIHRSGSASIYGDFRAIFTPNNGAPIVIGLVKGVAVYTPNEIRRFEIPMTVSSDLKLADGELRIIFLESEKNEDNGLIAETTLTLK